MRQSLFLQNKRGISPLIATVLLIAFAVALGAVVMNWGKNYVQTTAVDAQKSGQAKQKCTSTNIEFIQVSGIPKVCVNDLQNATEIEFTIKNKAPHEIIDIEITILGDDDQYEGKLKEYYDDLNLTNKFPVTLEYKDGALGPNKIIVGTVNFTSVGNFEKVIFTPYIKVDGQKNPEACSDNTKDVDADEIYECAN
jgi:flagellin-like protein